MVLSQETLFDTSDLKSLRSDVDSLRPGSPTMTTQTTVAGGAAAPGKNGNIEISLLYDAPMRKMTVHVLQAHGIPSRESGQQTHTQVFIHTLEKPTNT